MAAGKAASAGRTSLARKIQPLQQAAEPRIAAKRIKKRLDRQQVDEVSLMLNRLVQTLECQIDMFHSDRSESFRQRTDYQLAG